MSHLSITHLAKSLETFCYACRKRNIQPNSFSRNHKHIHEWQKVHATKYLYGEKFTKESNFFTFQPCFTFYNVAKSLISFPSKLGPERVIPYISSFVLEKAYLFCNKVFARLRKWISSLTLSTYLRHQWSSGYMRLQSIYD